MWMYNLYTEITGKIHSTKANARSKMHKKMCMYNVMPERFIGVEVAVCCTDTVHTEEWRSGNKDDKASLTKIFRRCLQQVRLNKSQC